MLRESLKGIKMKNRIIILNSPVANIGTQDLCEFFDELRKVEGTRIVFTNDFTTCSRVSNKSAIHLLKNGKKIPYNDMLKETEMFIKSYCENRLIHALECKFKNSNNFDVEFEKIIDEYIIF